MPEGPPSSSFSQVLASAAKGSNTLLTFLLDESGLRFEDWVCLNLLAGMGPDVEREVFTRAASARFGLESGTTADVSSRLETLGLVATSDQSGTPVLRSTPEGVAFFGRLRSNVDEMSNELIANIDDAHLVKTIDVLRAIADRAPSVLEHWRASV